MLIGPGWEDVMMLSEVVESVLEYSKVPCYNRRRRNKPVAENMKALSSCTCPVIFTRHTVEMSRLTGLERDILRITDLLPQRSLRRKTESL